MEASGIEFFERVRSGYIKISKNEQNRVKLINAKNSIEKIQKQVLNIVEKLI